MQDRIRVTNSPEQIAMLDAYTAENKQGNRKTRSLKHFVGDPRAAIGRIDSMFAAQGPAGITPDGMVKVLNPCTAEVQSTTLQEYLVKYSEHVRSFTINRYALDAQRPLRIVDRWEDDPIGSAGPELIDKNHLSTSDRQDLESLFKPFTGVVEPQHVHQHFTLAEIESIRRKYANNKEFAHEYRKREIRSKAIGENFVHAMFHEIVWLDLTFKLKEWAIGKGFDSLVYANYKESCGEDTYVSLQSSQVHKRRGCYKFLRSKYVAEIPPHVTRMLGERRAMRPSTIGLWGARDPMAYWQYDGSC